MLPYRVTATIVSYLSSRDVYTCVFVCRVWYMTFVPALYRNAVVSACHPWVHRNILSQDIVGSMVQELSLDDGVLSYNDMQRLRRQCPHLTSLRFFWCTPALRQSSKTSGFFYRSPLPALMAIDGRQLTCLELESFEPPSIDDIPPPSRSISDVRDVLQYVPNLQKLALRGFIPELETRHFHEIHACCPELAELELAGAGSISNEKSDASRIGDPQISLQKLRLAYSGGWYSLSGWFEYIVLRYPQLQELYLKNTGPLPTQFHPTALFFMVNGLQLPQQLKRASFIHLGATNIQRLIPALPSLNDLIELNIRDSGIHYFVNYDGLLRTVSYRIRSLCLPFPAYASTYQYGQFEMCFRLTDLTLEMSRQEEPRLDLLFRYCNWLKSLRLLRTRLTMDNVKRCTASLPLGFNLMLERIALEESVLDEQHALGRLVSCLRAVVDIELIECTWQHQKKGVTLLRLPDRCFRTVRIENARVRVDDYVKRIPGVQNHPVTLFAWHKCRPEMIGKKRRRSSGRWWESPVRQARHPERLDPDCHFRHQRTDCHFQALDPELMQQSMDPPHLHDRLPVKYRRYARMLTLSGYMMIRCAGIKELQLNSHVIR
ncbi:hypothetical protein BJV82DRAFT_610449 [Fennellomyces sp. T-0311]|nr:hypothetical protein BJV82DRAFT_610449 [Fennellomyces sp. T-0311]